MRKLIIAGLAISFLMMCFAAAQAATYYVSPKGDDAKDGKSIATAWKTAKKVENTTFQPDDIILFQRGGEWRERLSASSDGAEGKPITYDAYGEGAKPRFYGSDVLVNAKFIPIGHDNYAYDIEGKAESALRDGVFITSTSINGSLIITSPGSNPLTDGRKYTGCMRGNVIYSNRKNHLVFRNLVADETAGQISDGAVAGYGIRIEGSIDVLLENCEAYRCGRHHIAVINSTGFVGRNLRAEYVQPATPGGNTFYCSYADKNAPVPMCTSIWDDISADHMNAGTPGHGDDTCVFLITHGDRQGAVTLSNVVAQTKISLMSGPVIVKGGLLKERASIENWAAGALIDGVTLTDSSAIDQWASNGIIQNCVARLTPEKSGPTGGSTAIFLREKATGNIVRFNTLVTKNFSCLFLANNDLGTQWYGNIMVADGKTVDKNAPLVKGDAVNVDYNFYSSNAKFCDVAFDAWKAQGFDAHSLTGDPKLVDPAKLDYSLQPDSSCLGAAKLTPEFTPSADFTGATRSKPSAIGAFEKGSKPHKIAASKP
jgi:hypothetical protein